uniref:VOC family protein n=1 Tax=Streptomyces sp. NBC_00049 TaxID=2903617 RepID=A0AAU2JZN8_9ACTN
MALSPDQGPFSALGRMVVPVTDTDEALGFYREVLGFEVLHDETAGGYRYLHVGLPGQAPVGLWLMPPATLPAGAGAGAGPGAVAGAGGGPAARERGPSGHRDGGRPLFVLYTADVHEVGRRLRARGVPVWDERAAVDGRSLHFADPHGNVIVAAQLPVR